MDIRKIKKLIKLLRESQISEIEVTNGDESIRVCQQVADTSSLLSATLAQPAPTPPSVSTTQYRSKTGKETDERPNFIKSPMVGVFYASPEPNAPPFVQLGQTIKPGETLCIIEAMKIMNPIEAEQGGILRKIMVENGTPIEYGQPLFILDPQ